MVVGTKKSHTPLSGHATKTSRERLSALVGDRDITTAERFWATTKEKKTRGIVPHSWIEGRTSPSCRDPKTAYRLHPVRRGCFPWMPIPGILFAYQPAPVSDNSEVIDWSTAHTLTYALTHALAPAHIAISSCDIVGSIDWSWLGWRSLHWYMQPQAGVSPFVTFPTPPLPLLPPPPPIQAEPIAVGNLPSTLSIISVNE